MKLQTVRTLAYLVFAGTVLSSLTACAGAQPAASRPTVMQVDKTDKDAAAAPVTPPAPAPVATVIKPDAPTSTVAELQQLIQSHQVTELRTTYNGSYGASLLFKADDLVYYVALFQDKNFWRVLKTPSDGNAEATYRAFAAQSSDLAAVDIQRIKLQAENARSDRLLAQRSTQLTALQADQALRQQQEQQVVARQQQSREQAQALESQQKDVRQQLRDLQRQIAVLQAQQADVGNPLPTNKPAQRKSKK
jgi:flagellar biosynthesis GTPase FlhF